MKFNLDDFQKNLQDDLMNLNNKEDSFKSSVIQELHDLYEAQIKILEHLDDIYNLLSNLHVAAHIQD